MANRPIFIAGDVSEDRPLLHEAADEGRIVGGNAGHFPDVRVRPRRTPLAVVFSEPQTALAGASYAELMAGGIVFETGRVSFDDQGSSRVMGRNQGALHVYGEVGTGRFLDAEMLGPVVEEGLRTALRLLQRALHMGPPPVERGLDCGPGA